MDWREHIELNPEVLVGKPVIRGTRLSVDLVLEQLASGATVEELLEEYPTLTREGVLAALAYAAETLKEQRAYRPATR
jgi:uncharacterized protein (DUF433 family)